MRSRPSAFWRSRRAADGRTTGAERRRQCRRWRPAGGLQEQEGHELFEIHVYSSLPRQGTNTEQTNTLVEQIKQTLDGQKVGNFMIKYFDLDDLRRLGQRHRQGRAGNANKAQHRRWSTSDLQPGRPASSIPILNQFYQMVSPANSYPGLTKAVAGVTDTGEPDKYYLRGYRSYVRVIATDDIQGGVGAEWAKTQGKKKAYVLDDTQVYGAGLAKSWALHANEIGIEVVSPNKTSEGFDAKATDYNALAQKIKASPAPT